MALSANHSYHQTRPKSKDLCLKISASGLFRMGETDIEQNQDWQTTDDRGVWYYASLWQIWINFWPICSKDDISTPLWFIESKIRHSLQLEPELVRNMVAECEIIRTKVSNDDICLSEAKEKYFLTKQCVVAETDKARGLFSFTFTCLKCKRSLRDSPTVYNEFIAESCYFILGMRLQYLEFIYIRFYDKWKCNQLVAIIVQKSGILSLFPWRAV